MLMPATVNDELIAYPTLLSASMLKSRRADVTDTPGARVQPVQPPGVPIETCVLSRAAGLRLQTKSTWVTPTLAAMVEKGGCRLVAILMPPMNWRTSPMVSGGSKVTLNDQALFEIGSAMLRPMVSPFTRTLPLMAPVAGTEESPTVRAKPGSVSASQLMPGRERLWPAKSIAICAEY